MRIKVNNNIVERALSEMLKKEIDFNINGISIDSRQIEKNDIFIAIQGERSHGNDFINSQLVDKVSFIISDQTFDLTADIDQKHWNL